MDDNSGFSEHIISLPKGKALFRGWGRYACGRSVTVPSAAFAGLPNSRLAMLASTTHDTPV
jgi:hypothetical protein